MNEANLGKIPHSCVLQLQAVYYNLKSAEKKAADFLLEEPESIPALNTEDFARKAGCSQATIVRLSKKLGYEGYPELKADFEGLSRREPDSEYQGISRDDPPFTVLRKIFEASSAALADTLNVISQESYAKAVEAMLEADALMFCGVGDAALVAQEAYQRWARVGQKCFCAIDPDLQLILVSKLKPGDVLVTISHSGRSKSVLNVVREAENVGAIVVAITNFPVSPLAKRANFVLQTAVFTTYVGEEVMSKRVAELCLIEGLYASYILKKGESCIKSLRASNEVVKVNKQ
jgi:RpiR family transcriptional regulator, carbohydrate utilization regulator